jgi:hypothetical protein
MEDFGDVREKELRNILELPHGITDSSTFFRMFQRINPKILTTCLYEWLAAAREREAGTRPDDIWETDEKKGHGRLEKREIQTVTDLGWLFGK